MSLWDRVTAWKHVTIDGANSQTQQMIIVDSRSVKDHQSSACLAHLCVVVLAEYFQLPDIVLLHPPPGVFRVPVRGSFQILAHVVARPTKYERLASRMHAQEARHVVHPGPHQHPAGLLGTVAGHLPLREEPSGRRQRHLH